MRSTSIGLAVALVVSPTVRARSVYPQSPQTGTWEVRLYDSRGPATVEYARDVAIPERPGRDELQCVGHLSRWR